MSNEAVNVSAEQLAADEKFLEEREQRGTEKYIKRHSLQARVTHGVAAISCILLCISGCFVFIPPLTQAVGSDVVFVCRMIHRVCGVLFIVIPLFSAIASPKGVVHIVKNLFHSWDSDDKKWMALFFPYLFFAKWIHMPDQGEVKSGQRFADGMLWLFGLVMAFSGFVLLLGELGLALGTTVHGIMLFLHDFGFLMIAVFGLAHIFLGAGIFQPYRGTHKIMFGDGTVSESDALYHWGHWAREEITSGKNVVEKPVQK
mgnify:CR=1 FL=1